MSQRPAVSEPHRSSQQVTSATSSRISPISGSSYSPLRNATGNTSSSQHTGDMAAVAPSMSFGSRSMQSPSLQASSHSPMSLPMRGQARGSAIPSYDSRGIATPYLGQSSSSANPLAGQAQNYLGGQRLYQTRPQQFSPTFSMAYRSPPSVSSDPSRSKSQQVDQSDAGTDHTSPQEGTSDGETFKAESGTFQQAFYDPSQVKHRRRTTMAQLEVLDAQFSIGPKPDIPTRQEIAERLGMTPREVQVWFQNRRAKQKKLDSRAAAANARTGHRIDGSDSSGSSYVSPTSAHIQRPHIGGLQAQPRPPPGYPPLSGPYAEGRPALSQPVHGGMPPYADQYMPMGPPPAPGLGYGPYGYGSIPLGGFEGYPSHPAGFGGPPGRPMSRPQHLSRPLGGPLSSFSASSGSSRSSSAEELMLAQSRRNTLARPPSRLSMPVNSPEGSNPAAAGLAIGSSLPAGGPPSHLSLNTGSYSSASLQSGDYLSGLPSGTFAPMPRLSLSMVPASAPPHQQLFTVGAAAGDSPSLPDFQSSGLPGLSMPAYASLPNPLLDPPTQSQSLSSPILGQFPGSVSLGDPSSAAYGIDNLSLRRASLAPSYRVGVPGSGIYPGQPQLAMPNFGPSRDSAFLNSPIAPDHEAVGNLSPSSSAPSALGSRRPSAPQRLRSPSNLYSPYPQPINRTGLGGL